MGSRDDLVGIGRNMQFLHNKDDAMKHGIVFAGARQGPNPDCSDYFQMAEPSAALMSEAQAARIWSAIESGIGT